MGEVGDPFSNVREELIFSGDFLVVLGGLAPFADGFMDQAEAVDDVRSKLLG